jgi:tellurium resistance protein TerD
MTRLESICHQCPAILVHDSDRTGEEIECPNCHQTTTLLGEHEHEEPPVIAPPPLPRAEQPIRCPSCYSTQVAASSKGFGFGKAAVGLIALGPVGLLGGLIGSKKLQLVCMKCGKAFEP